MASEISKRYAKAFLAAVTQSNSVESALSDLELVAEAFKDNSIKEFFGNPLVGHDQKKAAITQTFKGKLKLEDSLSFLYLLADNGRISLVTEVFSALQTLIDLDKGVTRGEVSSAKELTAEDKASLEKKVNEALNKKIFLTYKVDSTLIGGVVVNVGGMTFDDSLKTHLKKMNDDLYRRAH